MDCDMIPSDAPYVRYTNGDVMEIVGEPYCAPDGRILLVPCWDGSIYTNYYLFQLRPMTAAASRLLEVKP